MAQATGATTRILVDTEASYGVPKSAALARPVIMPINTFSLSQAQTLAQAKTIIGNRHGTAPTLGNKDVSGSAAIPVDMNFLGFMLKAGLGQVATSEVGSIGNDIKNGAPTITIAALGAYTLSVAQTGGVAVGDKLLYQNADGTISAAYFSTVTNTTTGNLMTTRSGATVAPVTTAATVLAICNNLAEATPGTVTIASGEATFSTAQAAVAVGQMLCYDAAAPKFAIVTAKTSTTVVTVKDLHGFAPADATAKTVEFLGVRSKFRNVFTVPDTAELPSLVFEKGFLGLDPVTYHKYTGVKIADMKFSVGGDGELLCNISFVGALEAIGATSYGATVTPVTIYGARFQNSEAIISEGGSQSDGDVLSTFDVTFSNALDGDQYTINSGGARRKIPEGQVAVSGSVKALFEDTDLITKGQSGVSSSLGVTFTSGEYILTIAIAELQYENKSPEITGAGGVVLDLAFQGFVDSGTSDLTVTLTNDIDGY